MGGVECSPVSLQDSAFEDEDFQLLNGERLNYDPSDNNVQRDLDNFFDRFGLPLETSGNEVPRESWSGMLETKVASKAFEFANTMEAILEDDKTLRNRTTRLDDQIFDATMRLERNFKRKMP